MTPTYRQLDIVKALAGEEVEAASRFHLEKLVSGSIVDQVTAAGYLLAHSRRPGDAPAWEGTWWFHELPLELKQQAAAELIARIPEFERDLGRLADAIALEGEDAMTREMRRDLRIRAADFRVAERLLGDALSGVYKSCRRFHDAVEEHRRALLNPSPYRKYW